MNLKRTSTLAERQARMKARMEAFVCTSAGQPVAQLRDLLELNFKRRKHEHNKRTVRFSRMARPNL